MEDVADSLRDLQAALGPRRACVARELTKVHEQIVVGTLAELATRIGNEIPLRGEFVVVIGGDPSEAAADLDLVAVQVQAGSLGPRCEQALNLGDPDLAAFAPMPRVVAGCSGTE